MAVAQRRPAPSHDIVADTAAYERWQASLVPIDAGALTRKHALMHESLPKFLRGTYYRWARRFPLICPEFVRGAPVPSVGDVHVENFGTWRDVEGRLAWGINDVDEAWPLAQANDLIRLLTSALVLHDADDDDRLALAPRAMVRSLLTGYHDALAAGGLPYVLAESHATLREQAVQRLHDPVAYWRKIEEAGASVRRLSPEIGALLRAALPAGATVTEYRSRLAGVGSLGRTRVVALAMWDGARVAREAKALIPSAHAWHAGRRRAPRWSARMVDAALHARDPYLTLHASGWTVRRLAPDCSRIDLEKLPSAGDERHLLHAMGAEVANMQLGLTSARALRAGARGVTDATMLRAARAMVRDLTEDWRVWCQHSASRT
jgi:hypothetical protein